jgi:type VI secretion system secreted protein Hcp
MAAVDFFLKIDDVQGESGDTKHQNEIQVEEFSWEECQEGTGSGGGGVGAGKVAMSNFRVWIRTCKASPTLFLACANGTAYKTATLTCRKAGKTPQDYLTWTLSEVIVTKFAQLAKEFVSASGQKTVIPLEEINFNFSSIQYEYKVQKEDGSLGGSVKTGWNLKTNQKT